MKKITVWLVSILSLALVMVLPAQAAEFHLVADGADLLTDAEYIELNELAQDITDEYQCEMSIVIFEDVGDDDVEAAAKAFYQEYDYGYGMDKSGLMLFIGMAERDFILYAHGDGEKAFTDYGKETLEDDYLIPLLGEDKYYDAFLSYLKQTDVLLEMAQSGTPLDRGADEASVEGNTTSSFWIKLAVTILVPLLIAGVVTGIFLGQMKTAVPQRAADNFIPDGGVNLTMKADQFLFSTETRRRIEKEPSSGGSSNESSGSSNSKGKF